MLVKPFLVATFILAHSWYPPQCCGGQDCHPVQCKELIPQDNGTVKYKDKTFRKDQVMGSPDGLCHVCIMGEGVEAGGYPMCTFLPPGT